MGPSTLLRFTMTGSVDDGKSTLIGRLLHDNQAVYDDQLDSIRKASRGGIDYSLITDGLRAEREQGITIDVAYRYFATDRRRFIVADTPGHDQYTRNMFTGASTADVAVILVDVTRGVLPQTRRHTYLSWMLGIRSLCVAINKMDAIAYSQDGFDEVCRQFAELAEKMPGVDWTPIPVSALKGDNVVLASEYMPWYSGPTLLGYLEQTHTRGSLEQPVLRFPVQTVIRGQNGDRRYAGRLATGTVKLGDEVLVLPSSRTARVADLAAPDDAAYSAFAPMSIALSLSTHIDISRGDMIVDAQHPPAISRRFMGSLLWMSPTPLVQSRPYLLKHTTQHTYAEITKLVSILDVSTLEYRDAASMGMNDIGAVEIETRKPLYCDCYSKARETGSFIVIDPVTNETVGAGTIEKILPDQPLSPTTPASGGGLVVWLTGLSSAGKSTIGENLAVQLLASGHKVEMLDGDIVRQRLCKDLGFSKEDRDENVGRVSFVAELLSKNGVTVIVSAISPYRSARDEARQRIPGFIEVFVNAPIEVCENRDVKGLYRKARTGQLQRFTGIDDPYEPPLQPEVECRTDRETVDESVQKILDYVRASLAF
jgi:bifunctional enzyme CysN/CysC